MVRLFEFDYQKSLRINNNKKNQILKFRKAKKNEEDQDNRVLEENFKEHFYLFQVLEIFKNEYEFNSLYINDINNEEIHLFVKNLRDVAKHVSVDFSELYFQLLENILFYSKEFKVKV